MGRLKSSMNKLISPYQAGFFPGRFIHENLIIAKLVIHSMEKVKGKKGYFAMKVDLLKAYDRLS